MKKIVLKGFLEPMILSILKEKPMHGYALIKEIYLRTKFWKPSPGTIYPLLRKMEEEKLIKKSKKKRRVEYEITKKGIEKVENFVKLKREIENKIKNFFGPSIRKEIEKWEKRKKVFKEVFPEIRKHFYLIYSSILKGKKEEALKIIKESNKKLRKLL